MSKDEMKAVLDTAEASLNMEGLSISNQTRRLCERLLASEITMAEYIDLVKQKAGVTV